MATTTNDSPVWFVTGCSTGFGREFARAALAHGFRVVATARDPNKLSDIIAGHEDRAIAIALDVTNADQIKQAVSEAKRAFGRIDVLVNNAGYGYLAAVEEGEDKDIRAMFETNFFGLAAMVRAVLPGMRARRHGQIINIASVGGIVGFAGSGYYAATKFAVEGLSQSLAREVEPLGIRVLVVEPGPFRTDWAGRSLKQSANFIGDYEQTAGSRRRETAGYSGQQAGDPVRAAEAVIEAVQSPAPPSHLVLGRAGLENVEAQLRSMIQEVELWRATSLNADFPAT
ncbi:oxidoreductase [Bradyrhizobium sp. dw_411]|uniref:oxidoreductase n=1 Tax=Bradyrhizobium sp. dw_411 TaxID=2720082 RepID=UPI001BCDC256|nr:oxidoreductase [Bradyrhizobium sp. dw_411]